MSLIDRGFDVALAASQLSDAPRQGLRMGASLFTGSRLLAVGANLYTRSHPDTSNTSDFLRSLHAEHCALIKRRHYDVISRLTMYVARRRSDGTIGNSKPCHNCLRLCKMANISRIWYFEDGTRKEIIL